MYAVYSMTEKSYNFWVGCRDYLGEEKTDELQSEVMEAVIDELTEYVENKREASKLTQSWLEEGNNGRRKA